MSRAWHDGGQSATERRLLGDGPGGMAVTRRHQPAPCREPGCERYSDGSSRRYCPDHIRVISAPRAGHGKAHGDAARKRQRRIEARVSVLPIAMAMLAGSKPRTAHGVRVVLGKAKARSRRLSGPGAEHSISCARDGDSRYCYPCQARYTQAGAGGSRSGRQAPTSGPKSTGGAP